jgi:hypothetical protein
MIDAFALTYKRTLLGAKANSSMEQRLEAKSLSSELPKKEEPLGGLADLSRRELNPGLKRDKLAY